MKRKVEKINNSNVNNIKKVENKVVSAPVVNGVVEPKKEDLSVISKQRRSEQGNDFVEIPLGKVFGNMKMDKMRENPWILSTIVLGIVLIVVLISTYSGGLTGSSVSSSSAGQNVIDFINSQGQGTATLTSVTKEGSLYKADVNYNGQDVPVYVSLDGKYLIVDPIPLIAGAGNASAGKGSPKKVDSINLGDSPVLGKADAPITIVEFSDFQCPFCEKFFTETLGSIEKDYISTGKVKLVYKNFPLTQIHPEAQKAAEASECVKEQKGDTGFYKMHDLMFKNQATLSVDDEKKWARTLGVDGAKFDSCLDTGKYASAVSAEEQYGTTLGVSGTPAFFIGNEEKGYTSLSGAQPYTAFQQVIDAQLAA